MATFQVRVEDLTGTIGSASDTAAISDWLTVGAAIITDRLPLDKVEKYTANLTATVDGATTTAHRVLRAHKSGYEARKISAGLKSQAADSDSIYAATATNPIYYEENGKGYVLPGGGTIMGMAYPTVAYGDSTISKFPAEGLGAVVLYAAIQGETRIISELIRTTMAAVAWSAPTVVTTLASPSFTWTDAAIGTYTATTLGVTATVPNYSKPAITGAITQANTYIVTSEDIELAKVELERQNFHLSNYSVDIQNELNEFNKEDKAYQGKIAQEIKQSELTQNQILKLASDTTDLNKFNELQTLAEQVQEYQAVLAKHQSDVGNYSAQVSREANRIQASIQQYTAMYAGYFEILKSLKEEYNRALEAL